MSVKKYVEGFRYRAYAPETHFDGRGTKTHALRAVLAKIRTPPMDGNRFFSGEGGTQTIFNSERGGGFQLRFFR